MIKIRKIIPTKFYFLEYLGVTVFSSLIFVKYGFAITDIIGFEVLLNIMVYISFIDIEHKIIPNVAIAILCIIRIAILIISFCIGQSTFLDIINYSVGFAIGGAILLFISLISKKSIGMGDVKLVAVVGLYLGIEELLSCLLLSMVLTAIAGVILIAVKKINKKSAIPFAPFLAIGIGMVVLFRM